MKEGRRPQTVSKMPLSRLESLPVELLRSIFLYSFNVHLPLASPYIALALSSEHLYTKLVLLAFSGRIETGRTGSHAVLPSASFQTTIMSRRWFSLDLMKRCQVLFAQEVLEKERPKSPWEITSDVKAETIAHGHCVGETSTQVYHRNHLCERIQTMQAAIVTWVQVDRENSSIIHRFPLCVTRPRVERFEDVLLPEKLLHGPWTDEKLDLLEMLCKAGATVDWVNTSAGEIAERGLDDAIMEGNLRAVTLLTRASTPLWMALRCKNVGVRIVTRHARLAVLEAGCNLDMVEALVQHPESTVDQNDRQVVAWAVKHDSEGSTKGGRLLEVFYKEAPRLRRHPEAFAEFGEPAIDKAHGYRRG